MYNTSYDYRKAVRMLSRTDRLTGTIILNDGTEVPLSDKKIGPGGLSVTRKCVSGEELEFGGAILSTLSASFRTQRPQNAFHGAIIEPYYGIQCSDGRWFDIPLGIYKVAEPARKGKIVTVTAYDNLIKLDKRYFGQVLAGTPYEVLNKICTICQIPFGMLEADMVTFPNGTGEMRIDTTSGCKTYRDCVRQVAIMLGAIASADSTGAVVLRTFSKTPDITLEKRHRYSLNLSDYICSYDHLTIESTTKTVYTSAIVGDEAILGEAVLGEMLLDFDDASQGGLEMVIANAACWNAGNAEELKNRCEVLLDELAELAYTPASWVMPGDPSMEPGDRIANSTDEGVFESLVTGITWKFRGKMHVESAGRNPYLMRQQTVASELPLKDYNGDGKINLDDCDFLARMIVNEDPALTLEDDWNGDGTINTADVLAYNRLVIKHLGSVPNTSKAVAGEVIVAKDVEDGIVKETSTMPMSFGYRGECQDADAAFLAGPYKLTEATNNCPITAGVLFVIGDGNASGPIIQMAFSSDGQQRKLRSIWYGAANPWVDA